MSASQPLNDNEMVLYRVLQRANLLQYFDMFLAQGGDDVNQLCEAGEEEFLEIMALVGMASKPLHVRRLQKALHEWLLDPVKFKSTSNSRINHSSLPPPKGSIMAAIDPQSAAGQLSYSVGQYHSNKPSSNNVVQNFPPSFHDSRPSNSSLYGNVLGVRDLPLPSVRSNGHQQLSPAADDQIDQEHFSDPYTSSPCPSSAFDPQLSEEQIKAIEFAAAELAKTLPMYAPKPLNSKRQIDKEIEELLNFPDNHPDRNNLLRKYSAIYRRFDSKKRSFKQMNLHEICVNEAAAQLCIHRPALVTRREDLFLLARQVVKESGSQYIKGPAGSDMSGPMGKEFNFSGRESPTPLLKKFKAELDHGNDRSLSMVGDGFSIERSIEHDDSFQDRSASSASPGRDGDEDVESSVPWGPSSLMEEGLRIADQYGMGEFALEIRGIKGHIDDDDGRLENPDNQKKPK